MVLNHTQAYEDIKTGVKEQSSELKEQRSKQFSELKEQRSKQFSELKEQRSKQISELKEDVKDLTAKVDASLIETFGIRTRSERIEREVDNLERRR